ncbi:MAG: DUF86 domain-containing protein [Ignavibacteriae bacterium]|nr:DUF86 domain-containing protein [Ignavibacteriota bacterium]
MDEGINPFTILNLQFGNCYLEDEKTMFAVVRALEIIGEAVKNIPMRMRKQHGTIPWKMMAGMRDKLIHEYFGVDVKVVWKTIRKDIPRLKSPLTLMSKEINNRNQSKK